MFIARLSMTLFFLFAIVPGSSAETGKKPDPASVVLGEKLYQEHCQTCHQKKGMGEKPVPASLRQPGFRDAMPLNETSHAWHHGDRQMVQTILNGTPATKRMPAWRGKISEQEAKHIVAYIKSLWPPEILACQGPKHMTCKAGRKQMQRKP